jgi:hypothetical protein
LYSLTGDPESGLDLGTDRNPLEMLAQLLDDESVAAVIAVKADPLPQETRTDSDAGPAGSRW